METDLNLNNSCNSSPSKSFVEEILIKLFTFLCRLARPPRSAHGRETTGPSSSNAWGILPQSHSWSTGQIWQTTIDASFSTIGQSKDDWRFVLPRSPWQCSYRANALRYVQIKLSRIETTQSTSNSILQNIWFCFFLKNVNCRWQDFEVLSARGVLLVPLQF